MACGAGKGLSVKGPFDSDEAPMPADDRGPVREDGAEERNMEEREVRVEGVFEHSEQDSGAVTSPFVLVRDADSRCVMIWVGKFEAFAISMVLEKQTPQRPLTHDLLKNVSERLGARLDKVVVDDLFDSTFYAKIWYTIGGRQVTVDSRPSDAIALALRAGCPIFMTEAVLQDASRPAEEFGPE